MNILETSSACNPNISLPASDEFFQAKKKQVLITSFSEDLDESDILQVIYVVEFIERKLQYFFSLMGKDVKISFYHFASFLFKGKS